LENENVLDYFQKHIFLSKVEVKGHRVHNNGSDLSLIQNRIF